MNFAVKSEVNNVGIMNMTFWFLNNILITETSDFDLCS